MNTITINDKEYKLKYTIRALFIFELITGKAFEIKTTLDNYVFFYSMILANNPDSLLDWDDFLDALDADPALIKLLNQIVLDVVTKNNIFGDESGKGKKKR